MARSHKRKGAEGERDFARFLTSHGYEASRAGRQFFKPSGVDHQDVFHDVPGIHFEVKRQEKMDVPAWMRQAKAGAKRLTGLLTDGPFLAVVAWRGNRQPWRVIMDADDFMALLKRTGPPESSPASLSTPSSIAQDCTCAMPTYYYSPEGAKGHCTCGKL